VGKITVVFPTSIRNVMTVLAEFSNPRMLVSHYNPDALYKGEYRVPANSANGNVTE
jgi:hypothetical protein